jgi:hypothetical protein
MLSPQEEKKQIYNRLGEIEKVLNPTNDKFLFRNDNHPLCEERDKLVEIFYQYKAYENWFEQRHPDILVSMYITGATALQNRINKSVVYN